MTIQKEIKKAEYWKIGDYLKLMDINDKDEQITKRLEDYYKTLIILMRESQEFGKKLTEKYILGIIDEKINLLKKLKKGDVFNENLAILHLEEIKRLIKGERQ